MEERATPARRTITSWKEFLEALVEPSRYPRFPELTIEGKWNEWNPNPIPGPRKTSHVEQPPLAESWPPLSELPKDVGSYRTLQYEALLEGHIRLLSLHKAKMVDDVMIGLDLVTVSLSNVPTYEAISYCWGNTDLCTGIFVSTTDGGRQVLRVTENLATCLHSLVYSDRPDGERPGFIWIDQVCINQEDAEERNAQVRQMSGIYKVASGVTVWLGQRSEFSLEHCDLDLQPDPYLQWRGANVLTWTLDWTIFQRPWFRRLWVFQEAVFAQRLLFLVGTGYWTCEAVFELEESLLSFDSMDDDDTYTGCFDPILDHTLMSWIATTKRHLERDQAIDLAELMWCLQQNKCQDPRDRIFSLIGFTGNIFPADFVDYKQSTISIYQKCTRCLIEGTGNLGAITYTNPKTRELSPSWVPLWDQYPKRGLDGFLESPSASSHRHWKPTPGVVQGQLDVSSRLIDVIVAEVHSFKESMHRFFVDKERAAPLHEPFQEAWSYLRSRHQSRVDPLLSEDARDDIVPKYEDPMASSGSSILEPPSNFFHPFFRSVSLGEGFTESDRSALLHNRCIDRPDDDSQVKTEAQIERLLSSALHLMSGLFVLENGRLGFVRDYTRRLGAGDSIAILHGLDVPCILRKVEDGEGWLFMSDIYVDGIMHGEGKRKSPL
jgi:hypothetical protein